MTALNNLSLQSVKHLERERKSKVLVLAASSLDTELLPHLYEVLREIGKTKQLDVVLYGRGGEINAARRIALLLHEFTEKLCFLIPYHCQSSCTVLSLSGYELIASDMATFSPIDPGLTGIDTDGTGSNQSIDSENIRLFNEMCKNWFNLDIQQEEIRLQLLASVGSSIYPTTLTSLYRATLELKSIAEELLAFQLPDKSVQYRAKIVDQLLFGYHSHCYAITRADLLQIGLKVIRNEPIEDLAWQVAKELNNVMGGGVRQNAEDSRNDVMIATSSKAYVRQRHFDTISPIWKEIKL